jgi:ribosomal protein L7Ae-like RNA K-turn-binding protein
MGDPAGSGEGDAAMEYSIRRLLELLGLAARAGAVVTGTDAVRRAVREGEISRVFLAADAAPGQVGKLTPLLEARQVPFHSLSTRNVLGGAVGRAPVSALGLTNRNFARRAGELIAARPDAPPAVDPRGKSLQD